MLTCDERIWVIENYRNLGGVTACVNDWPFESAKTNLMGLLYGQL
jgi:hypothetical protein